MFNPVSSRVSFPEMEANVLQLWKDKDIFHRTETEREDGPLFMLFEGPPTANGSPGIHHVLARVFKDVICRYQTMKGYRCLRKGGWDTHGLPVELEVEKALGLTSKRDIEEYGIEKFNQQCRESVFRYVKEWEVMTDRIGYWVDMADPYVTLQNDYIETGWWILKELWDKGLLYQGMKGTPHCPRCVTSLSSHEVALGYHEDTPDPSVFVKFRVTLPLDSWQVEPGLPVPTYLLAWTTTPWTLPGNTALAVDSNAEYSLVEIVDEDGNAERLVLATPLLETNLRQDYSIVESLIGSSLVGISYEPLYDPAKYGSQVRRFGVAADSGSSELQETAEFAPQVVAADFVSMEDGTGIVHIAPAFGDEDLSLGREKGLAFVQPVDLLGNITGEYPFAGKFVKDADEDIMADLQARGLLHDRAVYRHTYPFCWRCETPLLYYAKNSWYIRTSAVKDKLIGGNGDINWYPDYIKEGRFGEWLRNNVDWAISRERYWGTPIPIWQCADCGHTVCAGSVAELKTMALPEQRASLENLDLHRPYVDDIVLQCPSSNGSGSGCAGQMRRIPEVMDAWFDSGAMPFAQWHVLDNADVTQLRKEGKFPADYICEAVDQTRGWFYSLHALSTLLQGEPSYKNVICLGLILDERGQKMSKRVGNVVEPLSVLDEHGADALRWYLFTASHPGEARRFSSKLVNETLRRVMLTLWNVFSFFTNYASIDQFNPEQKPDGWKPENELDRWILSELNTLITQVDGYLSGYDPTNAGRRIQEFIDQLSNWYVRRSRRRFWKSENDGDKQSAYISLYTCLETVARLMAPLAPFVAEELYQNLVKSVDADAPDSVHLALFPEADASLVDKQLEDATQLVMRISSMGRSARSKVGLRVRQPLKSMKVLLRSDVERLGLEPKITQLVDEINVKSVEIAVAGEAEGNDFWEWTVSPNLANIGPKHGANTQSIVDALAAMDPKQIVAAIDADGSVRITLADLTGSPVQLDYEDINVTKSAKESGYADVQDGPYAVAVETVITPDLAEEGVARDVVHHIQNLRRDAEFELTDRIVTYYQAPDEIANVITGQFAGYIRQETLSDELVSAPPSDAAKTETVKVEKLDVTLGVKRV